MATDKFIKIFKFVICKIVLFIFLTAALPSYQIYGKDAKILSEDLV